MSQSIKKSSKISPCATSNISENPIESSISFLFLLLTMYYLNLYFNFSLTVNKKYSKLKLLFYFIPKSYYFQYFLSIY